MDLLTQRKLTKIVEKEAYAWGNNANAYHDVANAHMDAQWDSLIWPILSAFRVDFRETIDLACGRGRNSLKLKQAGAQHVTLVDVNQENIDYCIDRIVPLGGFTVHKNNGFDLSGLPDRGFSHIYCFDAMVHFDLEIVLSYISEMARVLEPGGTAFIHHSNFSKRPGAEYYTNPHLRNFMSADIFKHSCIKSGLDVITQNLCAWDTHESLDCISFVRRPPS